MSNKPNIKLGKVELTPYSNDGPFNDPVVRCDSCNKLVLVENVRKFGKCVECGRNKFWNVRTFTQKEMAWMREKDVDPDFLKLFEMVEAQ